MLKMRRQEVRLLEIVNSGIVELCRLIVIIGGILFEEMNGIEARRGATEYVEVSVNSFVFAAFRFIREEDLALLRKGRFIRTLAAEFTPEIRRDIRR